MAIFSTYHSELAACGNRDVQWEVAVDVKARVANWYGPGGERIHVQSVLQIADEEFATIPQHGATTVAS